MIEKIGHIKNPLSIIAIFAGIAEISGTIVLPFVQPGNQDKYVWFLMLFPAFLVGVFFATLWFRPKALYAPSDYANEDNFMRIMEPATYAELVVKQQIEAAESVMLPALGGDERRSDNEVQLTLKDVDYDIKVDPEVVAQRDQDRMLKYRQAEERAFQVLALEYPTIQRNVAVGTKNARRVFDGVVETGSILQVFEIKVVTRISEPFVINHAKRFGQSFQSAFSNSSYTAQLTLVIVYTDSASDNSDLPQSISVPFHGMIKVRYMHF